MIDLYLEACIDFVENDDKFDAFKQDSRYTPVLEHVSHEESLTYINEMKSRDVLTQETLVSVRENDKYGNPTSYEYDGFGTLSPSTIRYLKNSLDILDYFGVDSGYDNIVEIGGGYGGLCKVFTSFVNFKKYTLFDLPEASKLSQKYLSNFDTLKNKVTFRDTNNVNQLRKVDLLISNYAFSECSRQYQEEYYNKVIKSTDKFYIIYNAFTQNNIGPDEFLNLAGKTFDVHVEKEVRPTHSNVILYGIKK
jgi:putative sugar O-methyltransferase